MTDLEERKSESTPWFLSGNYAPVRNELTEFDLKVTGAIPPSLSGRYLRNGSNPQSGTAGHWFFGDGMVHGVRLDGGKAEWYRNRYVQTTKLVKGLEATDPETMFDPTASAANTHVLGHAGRIWALEEGHLPYEISPELETLGCDNFGGKLTTAFTAHPKLCPETNELHFFGYSPVPPFLTYHVLDASGALVHSAEITVPAGTMMHDFMITRRPRDLHGPAGGVRPVEPRGAAEVGRQLRGPHRDHAEDGDERGHPLVRRRPLLRVPSPQRLCRRRHGRVRCRPPRLDVEELDGGRRAVLPPSLELRPRLGCRQRATARRRLARLPPCR